MSGGTTICRKMGSRGSPEDRGTVRAKVAIRLHASISPWLAAALSSDHNRWRNWIEDDASTQ